MANGRTYLVTWTDKYADIEATEVVESDYKLIYTYLVDDTINITEIRVSDDDFVTNRVDDYIIKV